MDHVALLIIPLSLFFFSHQVKWLHSDRRNASLRNRRYWVPHCSFKHNERDTQGERIFFSFPHMYRVLCKNRTDQTQWCLCRLDNKHFIGRCPETMKIVTLTQKTYKTIPDNHSQLCLRSAKSAWQFQFHSENPRKKIDLRFVVYFFSCQD